MNLAAELDVPEVVGRECMAMTRLQRQAADAFGVLETAQANVVSGQGCRSTAVHADLRPVCDPPCCQTASSRSAVRRAVCDTSATIGGVALCTRTRCDY